MIREGEVFVYGLDKPTAQALLGAAQAIGADPHTVRAIDIGFVVPEEVYEAAMTLHPPLAEGIPPDAVF